MYIDVHVLCMYICTYYICMYLVSWSDMLVHSTSYQYIGTIEYTYKVLSTRYEVLNRFMQYHSTRYKYVFSYKFLPKDLFTYSRTLNHVAYE